MSLEAGADRQEVYVGAEGSWRNGKDYLNDMIARASEGPGKKAVQSRTVSAKTEFEEFNVVPWSGADGADGEEGYRLVRISSDFRDRSRLSGRAGDKVYVVLQVPKLKGKGLKRKNDGSLVTRDRAIMTQWEMKNTRDGSSFERGDICFNPVFVRDYPQEFAAISRNMADQSVKIRLRLETKLGFLDSIWLALSRRHPSQSLNMSMLFLYLSLIPSTLFLLIDMALEVFRINDLIRHALGLA